MESSLAQRRPHGLARPLHPPSARFRDRGSTRLGGAVVVPPGCRSRRRLRLSAGRRDGVSGGACRHPDLHRADGSGALRARARHARDRRKGQPSGDRSIRRALRRMGGGYRPRDRRDGPARQRCARRTAPGGGGHHPEHREQRNHRRRWNRGRRRSACMGRGRDRGRCGVPQCRGADSGVGSARAVGRGGVASAADRTDRPGVLRRSGRAAGAQRTRLETRSRWRQPRRQTP